MAEQEQLVKKSLEKKSSKGEAVTGRCGYGPVVRQDAEAQEKLRVAQEYEPSDYRNDRDRES